MKRLKSFITLLIIVAATTVANAEPLDEVTLTVASDGQSKDDAVKNALRSAIEQTYGAFVSANTTILNDDLVKDEIVTISNGSIKEYKELSAVETANGSFLVTVNATVSLPKLISYAKSHGSECEFAGNSFGMEMKLRELKKENELKVLYNLSDQIIKRLQEDMVYEIQVSEPAIPEENFYFMYGEKYFKRHESIYSKDEGNFAPGVEEFLQQFHGEKCADSFYTVRIAVFLDNPNAESLARLIHENVESLALTNDEKIDYKKKNIPYSEMKLFDEISHGPLYYRNSQEKLDEWRGDLNKRVWKQFFSFVIVDNTGTVSDIFYENRPYEFNKNSRNTNYKNSPTPVLWSSEGGIYGTGLFHNYFQFFHNFDNFTRRVVYGIGGYHREWDRNKYWIAAVFRVLIPKDEIGKYSKFWVEPKKKNK